MIPPWLTWAREIQALTQTGLHFDQNDYNRSRYQRLQEIAAEIVAHHTSVATSELLKEFSLNSGYATVKVDVRGAVIREGRLLLVQEAADGKWAIPGGFADVGDGPADMVKREVWEESGLKVEVGKLIGVFDANRQGELRFHHAYKLLFLCKDLGGEPHAGDETIDAKFFDFDKIPELSPWRTNHYQIDELRAHLADSHRLPYFE